MTRVEALAAFGLRTPVTYRFVAKGICCEAKAYIIQAPTRGRSKFRINVIQTDGSAVSRWADAADLHQRGE